MHNINYSNSIKNCKASLSFLLAIWNAGIRFQKTRPYRRMSVLKLAALLWTYYLSADADVELREKALCLHLFVANHIEVHL